MTNATTTVDLVVVAFANAGDALASKMADANDVEGAWFLRGVVDRFTLDGPQVNHGNAYASHYYRGWNAAGKA